MSEPDNDAPPGYPEIAPQAARSELPAEPFRTEAGPWPPPAGGAATIPEDLGTVWSWPDLVLFLLFVVGSSVVLPLLVGLAAVIFCHVKPADIEKAPQVKATVLLIGQALWSAAVVAFMYATVRLRAPGPFWRAVGWREFRPPRLTRGAATGACLLGGVGLAVVVQLGSLAVGKKVKLPIEELFHSRQSVLMLMVLGILVAPLVEETIFRGYVYPVVARGLGVPAGIAITGTLFGLLHAPQLWGGWGQIALIILVGVVLTAVRARTGTVLASYLVHLAYNTMLFVEFFFATGGLRHFPTSS